MTRTFSKRNTHIRVKPGERFSIALDANPTAGYEWHATVDGDAVELKGGSLTPSTTAIGATAGQAFDLLAKRAGKAHVSLELARSWEKSPIETIRFDIEVEP